MPAKTAQEVLRGNPPSALHQPIPSEFVDYLTQLEAAAITTISYFDDTLADLNARAGTVDGEFAAVMANDADGGIYERVSGTWTKQASIPAVLTESLSANEAKAARDEAVAAQAGAEAAELRAGDEADFAATQAGLADTHRVSAAGSANDAQAAMEATGPFAPFDTKADADAALAGLSEGQTVMVFADESRNGRRAFYRVESGVLVFKRIAASDPVPDLISRNLISTAFTERRVNILPFKQALSDIRAGTRTSLRILTIGDSLATFSQVAFFDELGDILENHFPEAPARRTGSNQGQARTGEFNTASTATRAEKSDYTASFVGTVTTHTAGQVSYWSVGGFSILCDYIMIPLISEPGAGSVKIEIAEAVNALNIETASWRNPTAGEIASGHTLTGGELIVSADAAYGALPVALSFAASDKRVLRVTSTSGTVRIIDPMFEVRDSAGINTYTLAAGSNGFQFSDAASIPVMADFIESYAPDIIVVVSDDSKAAYENFLPHLEQTLDSTTLVPQPYVALIGNPGIRLSGAGTSQADLIDRINFCADYAAPRGWDNVDGMAMGLGIENLQTFQRGGDDVHLTLFIWGEVAKEWARSRGVFSYRENLPGGNVATRTDLATATGERQINAAELVHALLAAVPVDTGWMTYRYNVTGTASGAKGATSLILQTGTTAGSGLKACVDDNYTPLSHGNSNGMDSSFKGGWHTLVRFETMTAGGKFWVLTSGDGMVANYTELAGPGFGFRVTDTLIEGVSWDGSLQVSDKSVLAADGGTSAFYRLECVWTPGVAATGIVEWFVDGVSLGTKTYAHSGTLKTPVGFHLTNGADAALQRVHVLPPRLIVVKI